MMDGGPGKESQGQEAAREGQGLNQDVGDRGEDERKVQEARAALEELRQRGEAAGVDPSEVAETAEAETETPEADRQTAKEGFAAARETLRKLSQPESPIPFTKPDPNEPMLKARPMPEDSPEASDQA